MSGIMNGSVNARYLQMFQEKRLDDYIFSPSPLKESGLSDPTNETPNGECEPRAK